MRSILDDSGQLPDGIERSNLAAMASHRVATLASAERTAEVDLEVYLIVSGVSERIGRFAAARVAALWPYEIAPPNEDISGVCRILWRGIRAVRDGRRLIESGRSEDGIARVLGGVFVARQGIDLMRPHEVRRVG